MKCLVCGKNFNGNECPICKFPVVEIPGDYESGMRALKPTIDEHRSSFAKKISVSVCTYNYETENVEIVESGEEKYLLGNVFELFHRQKWLSDVFENADIRDKIEVNLSVNIEGLEEYELTVGIPNIPSTDKMYLGISFDDELNFCLMVKDESGNTAKSEIMSVIKP